MESAGDERNLMQNQKYNYLSTTLRIHHLDCKDIWKNLFTYALTEEEEPTIKFVEIFFFPYQELENATDCSNSRPKKIHLQREILKFPYFLFPGALPMWVILHHFDKTSNCKKLSECAGLIMLLENK